MKILFKLGIRADSSTHFATPHYEMGVFKTGVFKMGKIKTGFAENLGHCCHTSVIITFYSVCSSACKLAGWYVCAAGKGEGGGGKKCTERQ